MAKKIDKKLYKCMNFSACTAADSGEILEFDAMEVIGGKPKCPRCQQDTLEEQESTGNDKWKKIAVACAGVVVAAGVGFGVWKTAGQSDSGKKTPIENPAPVKKDPVNVKPVQKTEPQKKVVVEKQEQTKTETTPPKPKEEYKKPAKTDPKPPTPWASYASFDGTTMTFKKSHVIPGTSRMAQPGDKVTGVWRDGEVNSVRWYHADGSPSEVLTHD